MIPDDISNYINIRSNSLSPNRMRGFFVNSSFWMMHFYLSLSRI